jgi:hypothetical protein
MYKIYAQIEFSTKRQTFNKQFVGEVQARVILYIFTVLKIEGS